MDLTVRLNEGSGYPSTAWPLLTPEEEQEAIRIALPALLVQAQKEKHYRIQREEEKRKIDAMNRVPDTAEDLFYTVQHRGRKRAAERHWRKPFVLDDWNLAFYKVLAMYFTGDIRFENEGPAMLNCEPGSLSLHKGLIIAGPKGIGKSDMMELFARNPYAPFAIVSCVELENEYSKKDAGPNLIDYYAGLMPNDYKQHYYGHSHLGTLFDDFGAEGEANHMGKRINLMDMILQARYRNCRGPYTHLTTNASQQQIQETYDGRVYDRMIEMFNLIEFPEETPSRRI